VLGFHALLGLLVSDRASGDPIAGVCEFHELREPVDGRHRSVRVTTRRTTDTEEARHTTILESSASRYPRVVVVIVADGLLQTLAAVWLDT